MSKGSIFRRKDGRWEARLPLGTVDGKRRSKSFYGKTKEEAQNKLFEYLGRASDSCDPKVCVGAVCTQWLSAMSSRIKPSTQANYRMKLEKHILPEFGVTLS